MARTFLGRRDVPLGIRNNNPGNLRPGDKWQGRTEAGQAGGFVQFQNMAWGIRAMLIDLSNKIRKGRNTVRRIISAWAPPTENNTDAYIRFVARSMGVDADAALTASKGTLFALASAIAIKENGKKWALPSEELEAGWNLMPSRTKKVVAAAGGSAALFFIGLGIYFYTRMS